MATPSSSSRAPLSTMFLLLALAATGACSSTDFKGSARKAGSANANGAWEFTQVTLPVLNAELTQGKVGEPGTASFEQGQLGALDLLVVIDNSGSMQEEQQNLANKLEPLLSKVEGSDWQIAVVTTDVSQGCQRALIKKSDPDAKTKFASAIAAGTSGASIERGILQAVNGLSCKTSPWVRDGSTIAVLIVTDEDNCAIDASRGYGCKDEADRDGTLLTNYLKEHRTLGKDARVYGILWHPSMPQNQCRTSDSAGKVYADVITASAGTWGSICESDYSATLASISTDVAQILKSEFTLPQVPDAGSLQVLVNGQPWDKFTQEGALVKFTEAPVFGSKVEVSYKHGGGTTTGPLTLPSPPVPESLEVAVDGVPVAKEGVTWDDTAKSLQFKDVPAAAAVVKVTYKDKAALKAAFPLVPKLDAAALVVTINDQPVDAAAYKYDATTGEITFAPAPAEAAKIKVTVGKGV